jgi:hypothetical protein
MWRSMHVRGALTKGLCIHRAGLNALILVVAMVANRTPASPFEPALRFCRPGRWRAPAQEERHHHE